MKYIITILGLFIGLIAFGQDTIYYNKDWKRCTKENAEYFRVISLDADGVPIGKVKDYYITGELQWEGYLSYCDKYDNSKDSCDGYCVWYYKNGNKVRESNFSNNILIGTTTFWHEDGRIVSEQFFSNSELSKTTLYYYYENDNLQAVINEKDGEKDGVCSYYNEYGLLTNMATFKKGKLNGLLVSYDELEKIKTIQEYSEDEPVDNFWIVLNNNDVKIEKRFSEDFSSDNTNKWGIDYPTNNVSSNYIKNQGLVFNVRGELLYRNTIHLGIAPDKNFSIAILLRLVESTSDTNYGLIWGFKDWNNYNYFLITPDGSFNVGCVNNGIRNGSEMITSEFIKPESNVLAINKNNNQIIYSINDNVVYIGYNSILFGSEIGIMNFPSKTIQLERLEVQQDYSPEDLRNLVSKYEDILR